MLLGWFALAHAAIQRHDHVVRLGTRVDRSADLWYPQSDLVVREHPEGETELVAAEGTLRLADHHGVESAGRVREGVE